MHSPNDKYWQVVKRTLCYLKVTIFHVLFKNKFNFDYINAYLDSDLTNNIDERKSTTSYMVYLGANLVS